MNAVQIQLRRLHETACVKVNACLSPGDVEVEMSEFLDAALAHPEERAFVLQLFANELNGRCTHEFLQFYIHGLRWPEMLALIQAEWDMHPGDMRRLPILQLLRDAFGDRWEDAEFYKRFGG